MLFALSLVHTTIPTGFILRYPKYHSSVPNTRYLAPSIANEDENDKVCSIIVSTWKLIEFTIVIDACPPTKITFFFSYSTSALAKQQ